MIKPILLFFSLLACLAMEDIPSPKIQFDYGVHDRGEILQGEDGRFYFPFTNVGDGQMQIVSAKSSCGCLAPSWRKDLVQPGGRDTIFALYDTKRLGKFNKTLTVEINGANNKDRKLLRVVGKIIPKKINELVVTVRDSLRALIFDEYNLTQLHSGGASQVYLLLTNTTNSVIKVRMPKSPLALFYCEEEAILIEANSTREITIRKYEEGSGYFAKILFVVNDQKQFYIEILK